MLFGYRDASLGSSLYLLKEPTTWLCAMDSSLWVFFSKSSISPFPSISILICDFRDVLIQAHLAPGRKFNFQRYIKRSLEDDFKLVVGIRLQHNQIIKCKWNRSYIIRSYITVLTNCFALQSSSLGIICNLLAVQC